MPRESQSPDKVLHHHHRRIDQETEVERPQAHEVGRIAEALHEHEGEEHRQWDDRRDNQRCANIPEEEEEDERDEEPALEQVPEDGACRPVYDGALVVELGDGYPLRQQRSDIFEARFDARHDVLAVCPLEHHDHAGERFAPTVARYRPLAWLSTYADRRHISHVDRRASVAGGDHDVADVGGVAEPAQSAHGEAFAAVLDVPRTEIPVIGGERGLQITERDPVAGELAGVGQYVELLYHAAPRIHVGHSWQRPKQRLDGVLVQRL